MGLNESVSDVTLTLRYCLTGYLCLSALYYTRNYQWLTLYMYRSLEDKTLCFCTMNRSSAMFNNYVLRPLFFSPGGRVNCN